jgi:uncharacterized protein (DUF924 family)
MRRMSDARAEDPSVAEVLDFWFPAGHDADEAAWQRQARFWFRGESNAEVARRFAGLHQRAERGELDGWTATPRGRMALLLVLDQFSRAIHAGSGSAFANDAKAQRLALDTIERGLDRALPSTSRMFFGVALGHSEDLALQDLGVRLADELVAEAPEPLKRVWSYVAEQARLHREVIARFGRHPHRNALLGRPSTPAEEEYLRNETPPHLRGAPR